MKLTLTEAEAAQQLGLSPRTLADLRRSGKIRFVALSARKIAYRPEDVLAYRDDQARLAVPVVPARPRIAKLVRTGNVVPFSQRRRRE